MIRSLPMSIGSNDLLNAHAMESRTDPELDNSKTELADVAARPIEVVVVPSAGLHCLENHQ